MHTSVIRCIHLYQSKSEVIRLHKQTKKLLLRSAYTAGMLLLCAAGIRTELLRSEENAPAVMTAAGQSPPVIVLDAGHGGST